MDVRVCAELLDENDIAVFVDNKPQSMTFDDYVENEKKRMTSMQQEQSIPEITSDYVVAGRKGVVLSGYLNEFASYLYIPRRDDKVLVLVTILHHKPEWDREIGTILASFKFE